MPNLTFQINKKNKKFYKKKFGQKPKRNKYEQERERERKYNTVFPENNGKHKLLLVDF